MRKAVFILGMLAGCLVGGKVAMGSFVNDGFEDSSSGTSLQSGRAPWGASHASVMVSNKTNRSGSSGSLAAAVPIFTTLSNAVALASEQKVWTDFWTIPRPYSPGLTPVAEPDLSAMFFVSNGAWAVVYGQGGVIVTNVPATDIWGTNHVVRNDGTTWYRVSVYHNYSAKEWSFLVDGRPVITNKGFIASGVGNYDWFSVENGGGGSSNITWVDEVLVTNRVPASLTVDDDRDGMYDAWELMYFGMINSANTGTGDSDGDGISNANESKLGSNPDLKSPDEPGGTNIEQYVFNASDPGIVEADLTNASSILLTFSVGSNRSCIVQGSTRPNFSGSVGVVGTFDTGPNGETNWLVDPNALSSRGTRYFYRVVAVSPEGVAVTNNEVYLFHQQPRTDTLRYYWVGIPVDYGTGNTLNSTLGEHLARGLTGGNNNSEADSVTIYNPVAVTRYLRDGKWYADASLAPVGEATDAVSPGHGVMIRRRGGAGSTAVFAGSCPSDQPVPVSLKSGWNFICWPYSTSNSTWDLTSAIGLVGSDNPMAATADEIYRFREGYGTVRLYLDTQNVWRDYNTGDAAIPSDWWYYMHPGDGVYLKSSANTTWTP
jgi:hypothetical protein